MKAWRRTFLAARRRASSSSGEPPLLTLGDRIKALRSLPLLFHLLWTASARLTLANLGLRLARAALPLVLLSLGKGIVDEVVRLSQLSDERDLAWLWTLVAAECGTALLADALGRSTALVESLLGDRFAIQTSLRVMAHAAELDLERFEDAAFYDKFERARQQTSGRILLMSQTLSQLQDGVTMGCLAAGVIAVSPWLVLVLVITLVPAFLGEAHFSGQAYSFMYQWTPERRELDYLRYAGASDDTAKEVKVFGLARFLTERYERLAERFYHANRALSIRRAGWGGLLALIGSAGYYTAYVLIVLQVVNGRLSLGDLTFLAGAFSRVQTLLHDLLARFASMAEGVLYLRDLFDFLALRPRIQSPDAPRPFPRPIQVGFVFEQVGFCYAQSERWAVRGLSLTVRAGEKLALVGENGAGKTTVVKLLARLYDPTEGRILLDGHDLREYDVQELRREIGIIFQDFVRYQLTAADNIAVGRIEEREDRARIVRAAQRSLADTVIAALPRQYGQMVGRRFATGVELSGGEWQKLALARAYMREAQVMILDEPTAALDARAEHEVFQRFTELTRGKTAVLISHRFSTVRMADRIVVLERGALCEVGTHEELVQQNGRYADLFQLQARGYR